MTWSVLGGALALCTTAYLCFTLVNLLSVEQVEETVAVSGLDGIETIRVSSNHGSVQVMGADGNDGAVTGELHLRGGLWSPTFDERVEGTTLVLESTCPTFGTLACTADYRLTIPDNLAVEIDATEETEISDVNGAVTAGSSGGSIVIRAVAGLLRLDSSGGDISIIDSEADRIETNSSGGEISIIDSEADQIETNSSGGEISIIDSEADQIEIESSGGDIRASLSTPARNVTADSSGGDVTVRIPASSGAYAVDIETGGGTHTIEVATDPVAQQSIVVRSSGGDATVVYREASADSG